MTNQQRLGQWFVNILQEKHNLENIQLGDRMLRNVNLSQILFNLSDREFMEILLSYYAKHAWENRENVTTNKHT